MHFRVDLEIFRGPLDLLLYLVRKHELDVTDIRVSKVTEQYLEYIAVLEQIDVDAVGDFIEVASLLIEMKSKMVLPGDEEVADELEDPRQELVRRLLEYKQFRDAASMLEERSREWRERFPRMANDLPGRNVSPDQQPIQEVELWDLVSAFGRVLKAKHAVAGPESIRYDETPIHVHMQRIDERLGATAELRSRSSSKMRFTNRSSSACFSLCSNWSGISTPADQPELFGEIWLEPGEKPLPAELAVVADYDHSRQMRDEG